MTKRLKQTHNSSYDKHVLEYQRHVIWAYRRYPY